jgi:hypothetical protein
MKVARRIKLPGYHHPVSSRQKPQSFPLGYIRARLTNPIGRAFSKPPLPYINFMMTFHP